RRRPPAPAAGHTRPPASRGSRGRRAHGARAEGGAGVFRGRGRAPDRGEDRLVEENAPTPPVDPAAAAWTGSGLVGFPQLLDAAARLEQVQAERLGAGRGEAPLVGESDGLLTRRLEGPRGSFEIRPRVQGGAVRLG